MAAQRPLFDPSRIGASPEAASGAPRTYSVTQLNLMIKRVLGDQLPGTIHVVGQISNCCRHTSGHLYLTLKDDRSEVRAVMWKASATSLKFQPADGLEVIATGSIDVYEARGQYQFYIRTLEPRGVGSLELAFRQLRERLTREGLFEPARKKPIPRYPRRIAVVTSPTGAAIRDILQTLGRRFPCAGVLLYPVRVQGEGAAAEIAAALGQLNQHASALGGIDVILLARGGGSLEDLWAFNEESVARAIFASRIPIISGVGHEVDVTIADLVADVRAATPTAAAELAVPVLSEVLDGLSTASLRLSRSVRHHLDSARGRLEAAARFELFRDPVGMVHRSQQRVDECGARLQLAVSRQLSSLRERVHRSELTLGTAHPAALLHRRHEQLERALNRLHWLVAQQLNAAHRRFDACVHHAQAATPARRLGATRDKLDELARRAAQSLSHRLILAHQALDGLQQRLELNDYRRMLKRGFTITRTRRGKIITSPSDVRSGDKIVTQTGEGDFESRVTDANQGELFE